MGVRLGLAALALSATAAQALQITSVSPQGEVARIRQVVVKFDEDAVKFGDPGAPAPVSVRCSDAAASEGNGRWSSSREWLFDFKADLPPGVRCTVQPNTSLKSPAGAALKSASSYTFNSGGPFVQRIRPGTYSRIDEQQYFILQFNGAATRESVLANTWCKLDGVGERIPVRAVDEAERNTLLKAQSLDKAANAEPLRYAVLACTRRLTAGADMELMVGGGLATPSGVVNKTGQKYGYTVRDAFTANFSCERENAQAACLPIRPMRLQFSAPITRAQASKIKLTSSKGDVAASIEDEEGSPPQEQVARVLFKPAFAEQTSYSLVLPSGLKDVDGRALENAESFPLKVGTGAMPPLAKFAAAPFGVVELLAQAPDPAMLPVTLRNVEADLKVQQRTSAGPAGQMTGQVADLRPQTDADIIAWYRRVQRYNSSEISRKQAAADSKTPLPKPIDDRSKNWVQTRMVSLLDGQPGVKVLDLPKPSSQDLRPFEVVGIPLNAGFHVLEIQSQRLGQALLQEEYGAQRKMVVRTSTLVTNLGVHFKLGRDNSMAWITTLDKGMPVAGAKVQISSCDGQVLATAQTNAQGLAEFKDLSPEPPKCKPLANTSADDYDYQTPAYFVSARVRDAKGVDDMAFVWSDWNRGIEPWRFNVPTSQAVQPDERAHTVFDRPLLRAGETVQMKHLLRSETSTGFGLPVQDRWPNKLVITHVGSGQQYSQPLEWRKTATGGLSATSSFAVPVAAKLGQYEVMLQGPKASYSTSNFRVEEFRLPVLEGRLNPQQKEALVHPTEVPVQVQINYVSGGPAANLPVRVSALVRNKDLQFADFDDFSFAAPRRVNNQAAREASDEDNESENSSGPRVIANKLAATLDRQGAGTVRIAPLPDDVRNNPQPQELQLEASFADPNGEVQTLRHTTTLWPAAVIAGIKTEGWVSLSGKGDQKVAFQALALDLAGKPKAGVAISVQAQARIVNSSRKRMVGGFYAYDNQTETKDLGTVCSGTSDAHGLLQCNAAISSVGEVELIVTAKDAAGLTSQAAGSVYITRQGELWFGSENHDRMTLLPEQKNYQPGDTARIQVRMPFRFATALVAVEREGILETQVVQLNGQDPTVSLKIKDSWGPNVYVSVLALRGRLREVPWYSFFTWGFKAPREWWNAFWVEGREYVAPTTLVDLSKPAFRLGMAELRIGTKAHQLDVKVTTDQPTYPVRGKALVTIQVNKPDGKPAANAEVALAAVDQALLELMPNTSWNLLDAMLQRRAWGVETATAQMEIVGRRHYGRKAVPAGGGGGRSPTRELLDTLLLWNPALKLDAKGQAQVTVPLNDALTAFKIVAVADFGTGLFGTGQATIQTRQDLQIISGLPPLVREDDQFRAQLTLRNTTEKAMKVEVSPRATGLTLNPQTVDIPAGESRELAWDVTAPAPLGQIRTEALLWEIEARDTLGTARDALKARQRIVPAVPLAVLQATLVQLDGPFSLPVAPPPEALPGRGGLKMSLQPKLAEGLPGVRDWFANYPYSCLEQSASKAIGLRDATRWRALLAQLPSYLDSDGLANYFPPRDGEANRGSDTLTAYLLAAAHEAAGLDPTLALPDEARAAMERGLLAFVEGRIQRDFWSPRKDLDLRKLAALEALSRYGKAEGRMLGSISIAPNQWPTSAVLDWYNLLRRVTDIPQRAQRQAEATQIIKARLSYQGTKLVFSTERDDYLWWLMSSGDVNTARLILATLDDPAWKEDMGRLANGFLGRQQNGAWHTTTANLWGGLALEKFSKVFEATPVTGNTTATLGARNASVDWAKVQRITTADASGAANQTTMFGAPASPGNLRNNSMFLPWPSAEEAKTSAPLNVLHQGTGKPWLTLQSIAAVPRTAPFFAGYQIKKTITPVEQANKSLPAGQYSRGDVLRVELEINASSDMTWVVVGDPIPGGATLLGSGLGRDSQIATQGQKPASGAGWLAFEERSFEAYRAYYEYLPRGVVKLSYTVHLNNAGSFALPPTRVEAMYAPEMFGEAPNAKVVVQNP
jgi:uncharacterized protein YfaS (alpha-2-macroglobulin family)